MKAYLNDTAVKEKYLNRVLAHKKADAIVQGTYWTGSKGCAVGCTIEGSDHSKYETELGIPKELAYLEDGLFEEMNIKDAIEWPSKFLNAVQVGTDLSQVVAKFVIWEFEDKNNGLSKIKDVKKDKEVFGFCEEVVALYKRTLTESVSEEEFYQLYLKIDRAGAWARAGARAGAWAWAWAGARAGAGAGARAWAWAWAGAGAGYEKQILISSEKLLELIKKAPIAK